MIPDIESEITGATMDNSPPVQLVSPEQQESSSNGDNYERIKRAEVKHNWLQHEGTAQFLGQLELIRQEKLAEAENLAKVGHTDNAIRLLLQSCSIKETIEIIKNDN